MSERKTGIHTEASDTDGTGPQSAGRVIYADRYSNFATALAAATGNTLVVRTPMAVSTGTVVTATTELRFEGGGLLQKSGSGTINFQGPGLVDARSQHPAFSGFAAGDITWTGTDYPKELSLELWDTNNTSLSDRLERAASAFKDGSKVVKFIAFPRVITKSVELFDAQSIHFTRESIPTQRPDSPLPILLFFSIIIAKCRLIQGQFSTNQILRQMPT